MRHMVRQSTREVSHQGVLRQSIITKTLKAFVVVGAIQSLSDLPCCKYKSFSDS